jgi:hypothetical protein
MGQPAAVKYHLVLSLSFDTAISFADRVIRVALYLERFAIPNMNQYSAFAMACTTNSILPLYTQSN